MDFTGERFIPGTELYDNTPIAYEHWQRYIAASKLVKGKIVLDIACGEGYGSDLLAQNAKHVYGVDICREVVEHATNKYVRDNLSFYCDSVDKLNFATESIDIVVSFETIEHVDEEMQNKFLKQVNRILTKDGVLLISCPNKKVATEFAWDTWQYKNEFHVKEYYIDEFHSFLGNYFKYIKLFYQRYEIVLLLSSGDASNAEMILSNDKKFDHTQNIVAICSNNKIEDTPLNSVVLESGDNYLNTIASLANLQRHSDNLQKLLTDLQANHTKLQNKYFIQQTNNLSLRDLNAVLQASNLDLKKHLMNMQEQVNDLNIQISNLHSLNKDLENQNNVLHNLADELNRIYTTRSWKLLSAVYKIKNKLVKYITR